MGENKVKIKIVNKSGNKLPEYGTAHAAGMDIRASLEHTVILKPGGRKIVPTGLYIEMPVGFEAQIRPRSGLAMKNGITVLNSPGTIDADYRGEVKIIMINHSDNDFVIKNGDRICQMVISKYEKAQWEKVDGLSATKRGAGGFGHTGKK